MLEQLFKGGIREAILVVEIDILEDALEAGIGVFDRVEGPVELGPDVRRVLADVGPEAVLGNMEAVLVGLAASFSLFLYFARRSSYSSSQTSEIRLKKSRPKM